MAALQLNRIPSLRALFLQGPCLLLTNKMLCATKNIVFTCVAGNDIMQIAGLEMQHELRELVLDRNKIKSIGEHSFTSQWNLLELHLEENRLKDLTHIGCLENLQRLFLGMNRIQVCEETANQM